MYSFKINKQMYTYFDYFFIFFNVHSEITAVTGE